MKKGIPPVNKVIVDICVAMAKLAAKKTREEDIAITRVVPGTDNKVLVRVTATIIRQDR